MPSLLPVPGVVRLVFRGTAAGQAVVNVFHVKCGNDALAAASVTNILTSTRTAYQTHFVPRLNGNWSGDVATAVDLSSITGAEDSEPLGGSPTGSAPTMSNSVACCVTWRIARHYRGGHPRTYLGPVVSTAIETPTTFTSTYIGLVQNAAESFLTAVNSITTPDGPCALVCVHRQQNGEELSPPQTSPIYAATVDSRIDTMRRRLGPDR